MISCLESVKDPKDTDAFTKPFMAAFEHYCVLPHRKRMLDETMSKISKASDIVADRESDEKAMREKKKVRKRMQAICSKGKNSVEKSNVARKPSRRKTSSGKALLELMS